MIRNKGKVTKISDGGQYRFGFEPKSNQIKLMVSSKLESNLKQNSELNRIKIIRSSSSIRFAWDQVFSTSTSDSFLLDSMLS